MYPLLSLNGGISAVGQFYMDGLFSDVVYTECTKHEEHHPNIELHPLFPSEQPTFIGAWTLQAVECVPQGC
jgi:hypothetical protein